MISAGKRVTPYIDSSKMPQKVVFSERDRAAVRGMLPKVLDSFRVVHEHFKKALPSLYSVSVPGSLRDGRAMAGKIRQPQTAGPKGRKTQDIIVRVEVFNRRTGRIVKVREMKPRHVVMSPRGKPTEGRMLRAYPTWSSRASMIGAEVDRGRPRRRMTRYDIDQRDAGRAVASARRIIGRQHGKLGYRIVAIGGPKK